MFGYGFGSLRLSRCLRYLVQALFINIIRDEPYDVYTAMQPNQPFNADGPQAARGLTKR